MFEDFAEDRVDLGGTSVFVRHGGNGPPAVLLHGHPRTSATWHRVTPRLVRRGFTVSPSLLALVLLRPAGYPRARDQR